MRTLLQILILASLPLLVQAELDHYPTTNLYEPSVHSVTHGGRVRVVITKQKPKLHLPKSQRPIVQAVVNDDDTDYYNELPDLQVGYRRPELVNQSADVELSDHVKLRLALARMKAMQVYHQNWS